MKIVVLVYPGYIGYYVTIACRREPLNGAVLLLRPWRPRPRVRVVVARWKTLPAQIGQPVTDNGDVSIWIISMFFHQMWELPVKSIIVLFISTCVYRNYWRQWFFYQEAVTDRIRSFNTGTSPCVNVDVSMLLND